MLSGACIGGRELGRGSAIEVVSPSSLERVSMPFEVTWRAKGGTEGRRFAVFVDRAALAPGRDFRSLARREDDRVCLARPACPDAAWLESRSVYVVEGDTARITALPDFSTFRGTDREFHRLTIVEVDDRGRRVGEAGAAVEVTLESREGR